jgi:hypothetical protein
LLAHANSHMQRQKTTHKVLQLNTTPLHALPSEKLTNVA